MSTDGHVERAALPIANRPAATCILGHTQKAMECPACSGSDDLEWWRWYWSRTMSASVRAKVAEYLRTVTA